MITKGFVFSLIKVNSTLIKDYKLKIKNIYLKSFMVFLLNNRFKLFNMIILMNFILLSTHQKKSSNY
jgi:hypothetical protein